MANPKIRISLKAYDHKLIDQSAAQIIETAKKTGAKRRPKPASERTIEMTVQFGEKEVTYTDMVNRIKEMWKAQGKREVSMKSLELYVKPEESKVYYVINSQDKKPVTGDIDY